MPSAASLKSRSQSSRRATGSMPAVGSSRKTTRGSCISALPSARRCFQPPQEQPGAPVEVRPDVRELDRRVAPAPELLAAKAVDARVEVEVLVHGEVVVERELLAHVADALADLLALGRHVEPEHRRAARRRREQAAEDADQRRLAGAVRAEQAVDAARVHLEVHAVERGEVAELARHVATRGCATSLIAAP